MGLMTGTRSDGVQSKDENRRDERAGKIRFSRSRRVEYGTVVAIPLRVIIVAEGCEPSDCGGRGSFQLCHDIINSPRKLFRNEKFPHK